MRQQSYFFLVVPGFLCLLSIWFIGFVVAGTNEEGIQFLKENKEKPGVIELPSGLQYKVLRKGDGAYHPSVSTPCLCHYAGTLIDGTTFDSSYDRGDPTTFAPNQVIAGWTEAMQLMVVGDKWEMYIPSELGYGDRGSGAKIPGGSVLIFTMEILELKGDESTWVPALKCNPKESENEACNEEEKKYTVKIENWDTTKKEKEVDRLQKMLLSGKTNVKPDLVNWMRRRLHILKQLVQTEEGGKDNKKDEEL